jgi:hypothetical protein
MFGLSLGSLTKSLGIDKFLGGLGGKILGSIFGGGMSQNAMDDYIQQVTDQTVNYTYNNMTENIVSWFENIF